MSKISDLPKAELHVHIEGTVTPNMARRKAAQHGIALPPDIFTPDGSAYQWRDFLDLVTRVYQSMSLCIRTKEDYTEIVYDYLKRSSEEDVIYTEFIAYPGQCDLVGIDYKDIIDGIAEGIDKARADFGIEARMNVTLERHLSPDVAEKIADRVLSYPHPYIVGLDIAGGENEGDLAQFFPAFNRIQKHFGHYLGVRMHAGEGAGPGNVWDAVKLFGAVRIGHGVRAIEDAELMKYLVDEKIVLEVCPTSNILADIYPDYKSHPLRRLYEAGVNVTLASDDPGLFNCTIGGEYEVANKDFGFSMAELKDITLAAIEASFADDGLKEKLRTQLKGLASPLAQPSAQVYKKPAR